MLILFYQDNEDNEKIKILPISKKIKIIYVCKNLGINGYLVRLPVNSKTSTINNNK